MSRIFMSHSSRDMREAVALKQWLAEQDPPLANEIFLDVDPESGLRTGTRWKDALRRANARCEAVICLLSPNWERSHECKVEYRTAENLNKQIFCARLEASTGDELTSEWQRCDLFTDGPRTRIDIGDGPPVEFATEGLYRLRDGIRGAGIGAESFVWPPPDDPGRAPYRGWESLDESDAAVFFGRDAQIVRALDAVRGMRMAGVNALFVVLGPSGTGKSSFLRAGLLPRLRREDRRFVLMDLVRPERNPLIGASGFAASVSATREHLGLTAPSLGDIKQACSAGDVAAVAGWLAEIRREATTRLLLRGEDATAAAPTLVLPLDQAEELFGADVGDSAAAFLRLLAGLVDILNAEDLGLVVAATIRTDRYEVMQTHPMLARLGTVLFDELKPMPLTQFKEVITGPAERASDAGRPLRVTPDLVDRLLADASDGADTLPILALTLSRLYTDYGSTGELTLAGYEALGGMRRVVQTEIDEMLAGDSGQRAAQLEALKAAFIPWLATINPDNDQPMRRVARYADLPAASRPLIDALVAKRLMVKDNRDGQVVVEVALESLLRQWDELAGWLRDERKDLKDADDLERTAAAWVASGHNPAWLLEGSRLTEATALVNRPGFADRLTATHPFLNASHQREGQRRADEEQQRHAELRAAQERAEHAQERQATAEAHAVTLRKRSRIMRAVLALTAVIAVIAAVGFVRANAASNEAQNRFREATSVRLTSEALAMLLGNRPGDDIQATQEMLAARALTASPDDEALYDVVTKDTNTKKIISAGHMVWGVAVSPDGRRIAGCGRDGFVQVWDAGTGQPLHPPLAGSQGAVLDAQFSPDSSMLATAGNDHVIRLWDVDSGRLIRQMSGHTAGLFAVSFSPDGRQLATTGEDLTLRTWDVVSGRPLRVITTGDTDIVTSVAFSPDGRTLLTGSDDGTARLWDAATLTGQAEPLDARLGKITSVAFSPDGQRFAIAGEDLALWDTDTRQLIGPVMSDHADTVSAVAFSPDGTRLASASADATIRVWDGVDGGPVALPISGHEGTVFALAYTPDGDKIVSGSRDGTVRVRDPTAGQPLFGHSGQVRSVAFSPDARILAGAGSDGAVSLWDPVTRQPIAPPLRGADGFQTLTFSSSGDRLAAGDYAGRVLVWDTATWRLVNTLPGSGRGWVDTLSFKDDGTRLSAVTSDGVGQTWDLSTNEAVSDPVDDVTALTLTPSWGKVAFSPKNAGFGLQIVDLDTGENVGEMLSGHTNTIRKLAFSPDGTMLLSAGDDNTIRRWNAEDGTALGEPSFGHSGTVQDVAFSPDGSRFVTGSSDATVRLWDARTGRQFGDPLTGHGDYVMGVAFSPDGASLASASNDGTVRLWPATATPEQLCAKLTQNMSAKQWDEWVSPDIDYVKTCPDLPVAEG